jgi:hypothetical protein
MSVSMYRASIPVFIRGFEVLASLLQKAASHAQEKGLAPSELIGARLFEDMLPLSGQIQRASDTAKMSAERLSGVASPRLEDNETTFAQLQTRIADTIAYLASIDSARLDGSEARTVTIKFGSAAKDFRGDEYLFTFGLANFYFHLSTAYGILRHLGVPVGKLDYLGSFA